MKTLKPIYERYLRTSQDCPHDVYEAYKTMSNEKERSQRYCDDIRERLGGYNACVLTHNTFIFTYCFMYDAENTTYFVYITPTYDRKYDINTGETSLL